MKSYSQETNKGRSATWLYLSAILLLALTLRLTGIWRTEPINYQADEDKIARPVFSIANNAEVGLKRDYNWPICGIIYPLGYSLYALKGWFGPYSYNNILIVQRVMSTLISTAVVFVVFLFMRKLFSRKAALFAAGLMAVAKLPVANAHDGIMRCAVSLIVITVMLLVYDLFDTHQKQEQKNLRIGRCCFIGLLCGWGVAIRWTILLTSIPIFGAMVLSIWSHREIGEWKNFAKINTKKIMIIAALAILSFLAANPDFQFAPEKVLSGMMLHKKQGKVGHYGKFSDRSDSLGYKLSSLSKNMSACGSIYFSIPGLLAIIYCLTKPTKPKLFLLWTMLAWLVVVYRNVLPLERYHLIPFIMMLIFMSIAAAALMENPKRWVRGSVLAAYIFVVVMGSLYSLIYISAFWKTDARILCSRWIRQNVPAGSGVTWAPRTHKWMAPGVVVDPGLFKEYPRRATVGKDQYLIAAQSVMDIFKKHPPDKNVNPADWFPSKPPSMNELVLYSEMNAGSGKILTLVKEFRVKSEFLGLDLRLFGRDPNQITSIANYPVSLFRINRER